MGDRGNIVIRDSGRPDLFLYTHWERYYAEDAARKALSRHQRWDDPSYLARIVFDAMTEGDAGGETGFGISTVLEDGDQTVVLDCGSQTVTTADGVRSFIEFVGDGT